MDNILVIGIAGGSGSGKTTLTSRIAEQFPEEVTVIRHDDYYRHYEELTLEERKRLNYDHPSAFDTELLIRHLMELKQGRPVECRSMIMPSITEAGGPRPYCRGGW